MTQRIPQAIRMRQRGIVAPDPGRGGDAMDIALASLAFLVAACCAA